MKNKKNYKESMNVRIYDLDLTERLSFPSICNYLQESATKHADELNISAWHLTELNITWVLYRIQVKMNEYPGFNKKVKIDTWPAIIKDPCDFRAFRIFNEKNIEIGNALYNWLLINLDTRKPVRIPEFLYECHDTEREIPFSINFKRLKKLDKIDYSKKFSVLYDDIDIVKHTNNVSYIKWALESIPFEIRSNYQIDEFEIEFRVETFYNDKIISESEKIEDDEKIIFNHQLLNKENNIIALAKTQISK
jgi:medium-chain acyl-[acyl-carrier-protein] hydrolase